MRKRLSFFNYF